MNKINILIVEDSTIFAEGITALLKQNPIVASVYHRKNQADSLKLLKKEKIDIILLDLNFDAFDFDGFTISKKVKQLYSQIKIIVISQHAKIDHYENLVEQIGVDAYLDKRLSVDYLNKALKKILKDEVYVAPDIKRMIEAGRWLKTSSREQEVIDLLSKGNSYKIIANKLCINIKTVESHLLNIRKRHNFSNSVELVSEYIKYKNSFREDYKKTTAPFRK
jgi:DNA-binding NarL/FixJ family response regulator